MVHRVPPAEPWSGGGAALRDDPSRERVYCAREGPPVQTRTRTVVLASLVVALAFGFFVAGGVLYKTAIDLDAPGVPGRRRRSTRAAQAVGLDFGRPDRRSVLGSARRSSPC